MLLILAYQMLRLASGSTFSPIYGANTAMTPIKRASQAHLELIEACYHPQRMKLITDFVDKLLQLPPIPLMKFCTINADRLRNNEKSITQMGEIFEQTKLVVDALNYILKFARTETAEQTMAQLLEAVRDFSLKDFFEFTIIVEHRAHHNSELR